MLQKFREAARGVLNDFFVQISDLSYGIFIWTLACILFWAADKKTGAFLFLNIAVNRFVMQLLKLTFCVYRPWIRDPNIVPVETASGYSFPSGHSVTSASNYGTVLARYGKKHRGLGAFMAVTRCGVGVLVLLLYELSFMPAVTGAVSTGWIGFVLTFGELMVLVVVYPLCFSRLEGRKSAHAASAA